MTDNAGMRRKPMTSIFVHETTLGLTGDYETGVAIDAGSGSGALTESLQGRGFPMVMLDRDEDFTRSKPEGVDFILVDLNHGVPLRDCCVDYLFAIEVIEHLWNPYGFIREVNRTLRGGGMFMMSTPNVENIWQRLVYMLTGRYLYFKTQYVNVEGDHFSPIFENSLRVFCRQFYEFVSVTYNACFIPYIGKLQFLKPLTQLKPLKNHKMLGEIAIYQFKKIPETSRR
ncbi:MAG: class I SAM-dependent methyltransferase [Candidatus Bathyarchaeota archaeon]|jgi:SAM-dependent methyltransferase